MIVYQLTWEDVDTLLAPLIPQLLGKKVYGIPRGGRIVAGLARQHGVWIVSRPEDAEIALDDIIDSGATANRMMDDHGMETVALIDKRIPRSTLPPLTVIDYAGWVVFPWEESQAVSGRDTVTRMLEYLGEDPNRDGLRHTPERVIRAWEEMYRGYTKDPDALLTWFEDDTDEMVVCRNIQFYSTCEHHLLPFYGKVAIGYIPEGKVLGISKLARVTDVFARRLQVQERLTREIGEFLGQHTSHVAVHIEAVHMCMMARGVGQQTSSLATNYLTGAFREKPEARQEFFDMVKL